MKQLKPLGGTGLWTLIFSLFLLMTHPARASWDNDWWSMGPVGGSFQLQPGAPYLKVQAVTASGPADTAGLQVGDYIMAAFGKDFSTTSTASTTGYKGAAQDFANAIERAESTDGVLPLTVMRAGTGAVNLTVNLPIAGAFGPAYPLGSSKFDAIYQTAAGEIHSSIAASSTGDAGYMTGFYGLILLADPNWNDTTGPKPYRLSIDKMKDHCVSYINGIIVNPVEATNLDGTPNDGSVNDSDPNDQSHVGVGLENWTIAVNAMFLAEYRKKAGDTSVDTVVQRAADALAGRIQTWQQPPYDGYSPTKSGLMGHGGVTGDYPHISYAGINIINAHAMTALAMLKEAGATVDDTKMQASWNWVKGTMYNDPGHAEDGNIGYAWVQGGYDSGGRTAGVAFSMSVYGGLDSADQAILARMKDYVSRQWQRMQHAHAYTVAGNQFYQFLLPYLPDRDQRYIMENQRMFYHFHRTSGSSLQWFGGRENNGGDGYVGTHAVALTNVGMAQAIASGNLTTIAPIDGTRIHADFQSPFLTWPSLDARHVEIDALSQAFTVDITDYQGASLLPADYSATWTHVSGPATATFTSPNTSGTTVNFPQEGTYRIQLEVVKGGYTLTEPIDVVVDTSVDPVGYVTGHTHRRIYTGISGSSVADLTGNAKFPNAPDVVDTLPSLYSAYDGDSYGTRLSGYIIAPTTGSYTFYIAGDDGCEFQFNSAGTDPAGATAICSVTGWTNLYEWTKEPGQTSASVSLTAGQLYYYEVLHKEGGGGNHVAVGWTGPGIATTTVIAGDALAVADTHVIVKQPVNQTESLGGSVTMSLVVEGSGPYLYEWFLDGSSLGAGASSSLSLSNVSAGHAGNYYCVVTHPGGTLTSTTTTLEVDDAGILVQGGLWRDQFDGIGGGSVSDLTGNSSYPRYPTSGGVVTEAEDVGGVADSYGARFTGWIRPDVNGDYYFYIASDDSSQLWLSTDEQPVNKVNIASVSGYRSARAWNSGGQSAAITLTAGQRYYIEILHKEGGGGDHCAVAWRKPGEVVPVNGSAPISSQYLEYFSGGVQGDSVVIPPYFNSPAYQWSVAENVALGTSLGTVQASDDSGNTPLSYAITGGNTEGAFTINSTTGEVTTAAAIDYETTSTFALSVQVTNTVGSVGQVTVNISVSDRLDGLLSWEPEVDQGTAPLLKRTTPLAGNTTTTVDLSGISGDATYEFLVHAEDLGRSDVRLLDGNGWSLRFEQVTSSDKLGLTQYGVSDYHLTPESGQSVASPYGRVAHVVYVVDTVTPQTRVYVDGVFVGTQSAVPNLADAAAVLGGSGNNAVRDDTDPGILAFAAYNNALNATEIQTHFDAWSGNFTNVAPVASDATLAVAEQSAIGTVLGTVSASDTNAGDVLSYSMTAGNEGGEFAINSSSGQITTAKVLSYDYGSQYVLTVLVSDINGLTDNAIVTVNVSNEPGGVTDWEAQVDAGSAFLHKWTVPLAGNTTDTVDLSGISGDATYEFVVNSEDLGQMWGNLLAANGWQLRNEQWENTHALGVTLSGNTDWQLTPESGQSVATPYDRVAHIVYVVDVSVPQLRAYVDGVLVGTLAQAPNMSHVAAVLGASDLRDDSDPGILVFAAYNSALDAAEIKAHSDAWFGALSNSPPVAADATLAVAENRLTGTTVGTVGVTDPDTGDSWSFAITAGNAGGEFFINSSTGEITTAKVLDYETQSQYVLTVRVTDASAANDDATITINVTDVNETQIVNVYHATGETSNLGTATGGYAATTVSDDVYETLTEVESGGKLSNRRSRLEHEWIFNVASGVTSILRLEAHHTSNSEGDDFIVSYSTDGVNYTDLLTVTKTADDDVEQTVSLPARLNGIVYVRVLDADRTQGNRSLDSLYVDFLAIEVLANSAPDAEDATASLAENVSSGAAVHTVAASDPDAGDNLSYAITGGNSQGLFVIDSSGNITTTAGLDHETADQHVLTVTVSDDRNPILTDIATITVDVTDVQTGDDSGGNTLNDNWEVTHFGVVNTVAANADTDGDGLTTYQEMVFGGDPNSKEVRSEIAQGNIIDDSGTLKMEFKFKRPQNYSLLGVVYQLQICHDLQQGSWGNHAAVPKVVVDGANEWLVYKLDLPSGATTGVFCRCLVSSAP